MDNELFTLWDLIRYVFIICASVGALFLFLRFIWRDETPQIEDHESEFTSDGK